MTQTVLVKNSFGFRYVLNFGNFLFLEIIDTLRISPVTSQILGNYGCCATFDENTTWCSEEVKLDVSSIFINIF